MKINEVMDFKAICPHCEEKIDSLNCMTHGNIKEHYIYCCPKCDKIISVAPYTVIGFG